MNTTRPERVAAAAAVAAGIGRAAVGAWSATSRPAMAVVKDSASYLDPAQTFLEHGRFAEALGSAEPMFVRTPGYPAFLALLRGIGLDGAAEIVAVQGLLSGVTVWFAFVLARRLWDARAGAAAAVLCAVEPLQWWSAGSVLSESLHALVLLLVAVVVTRALPQLSRSWLVLAGVLLAAAAHVRPVTYYLPLLLAALVVAVGVRQHRRAPRLAAAVAAVLLPPALLLGAWQGRNHERVDSWRFSGVEQLNLYEYRAGAIVARQRGIEFQEARELLQREIGPRPVGMAQGPYYGEMGSRATEIILADVVGFGVVTAKGFVGVSLGVRTTALPYFGLGQGGTVVAAASVLLLAFYALCAAGSAAVWRGGRSRAGFLWVVLTVGAVLVLSSGPEGYSRSRAPVMPLLTVVGGIGAAAVADGRRRRVGEEGRTRAAG